jgi:glycosyltransferase involved in cell wall biosynthesis
MSAYACEPGRGSEPGAGWAFARAAALRNDVWLMTRRKNKRAVDDAIRAEPWLTITPVYVDLPRPVLAAKRGSTGVLWYYLLWQARAAALARDLHLRHSFDVAHHVTFAADWMPAAVAHVPGLPFVWGPVGGSTGTPWRLWRWLGARGLAADALRYAATGTMRRAVADPMAARAALVVAQNQDVAARFPRGGQVVVRPNVVLDGGDPPGVTPRRPDRDRSEPHAVFVGRLVAWKGVRLAVAALAQPAMNHWHLEMYGEGAQRQAVQRIARRLGVATRVHLHGQRPRAEVLAAMAAADAFLFPSMHDSAPWAVGEARAVGCPVVYLRRGGCPILVGAEGGVAVDTGPDIVGRLARALVAAASLPRVTSRWDARTLPDELDGWYARAVR